LISLVSDSVIVPLERIQNRILVLRGQRVLLDSDLAEIYGVPTRQLKQAVRRNIAKFPEDFAFEISIDEAESINRSRSQNVTLKASRGGNVKYPPFVFTEHGAIQAANVLRSDAAVQMSVQVVRAFIQLRHLVVNHKAIRTRLTELEDRIGEHDEQLGVIVDALRQLSEPVSPAERRRIGFGVGDS